jgi:hypothetical protein
MVIRVWPGLGSASEEHILPFSFLSTSMFCFEKSVGLCDQGVEYLKKFMRRLGLVAISQ